MTREPLLALATPPCSPLAFLPDPGRCIGFAVKPACPTTEKETTTWQGMAMILQMICWLIALAGGITILVGLLSSKTSPAYALAEVIIGAAMVAAAFMLDAMREKNKEEAIERRVEELTSAPWKTGKSLKLGGRRIFMLFISLLPLALGLGCTYGGLVQITKGGHSDVILLLLCGAFFLMMATFALMEVFAGLGKAGCELDSEGFTSYVYGRISWQQVTGISCRRYNDGKGPLEWYELVFQVSDIEQVIRHAGKLASLRYTLGLLGLKQGILAIQLSGRERPETAFAVARFLWKQARDRKMDAYLKTYGAKEEALENDRVNALRERFKSLERMSDGERMSTIAELEKLAKDIEGDSRPVRDKLKKGEQA